MKTTTTTAKEDVRSTRKLLHHISVLLASMPEDALKKLSGSYRVVTTIMIPRLEYIPKITHDDLVIRELAYFKFCKEIQENTRFKKELNKKRAKGEFLLLAFVLQGKNEVTHEWNVMQLNQNDDGNLMNHSKDPRPKQEKEKGKEKEKVKTFADILKLMESKENETKQLDSIQGLDIVVNGILPEDLMIPDSSKKEEYLQLRKECRKVVLSTTMFLQEQEDEDGNMPIPQDELNCISKDMAGLFHQRAVNEIFGGNKIAFTAATALSQNRKNSQQLLQKPLRDCKTCGARAPIHLRCGGCGTVWYCDVVCQKKDWTEGGHKKICISLRNSKNNKN